MTSTGNDAAKLETWSPEEIARAQKAGRIALIDVRTPAEYAFEHVEGAMLMPMAFFDPAFLPGQSDKRLVLMCGSSARSEKMARAALEAGVAPMAHMEGGFGKWKASGLPYVGTDMASGAPKRMEDKES